MKFKSALLGLLISGAVAAPVVHAVNVSGLSIGQSVVAYSGLPANGEVFANWTNQFRQWSLSFGVNNATQSSAVGLRITTPTYQRASNWTMDVNTTNGNIPFFETWAIQPGNNLPQLAKFSFVNSLGSDYTVTPLGHGFNRVKFDATTGLPSGSSFSTIYFADEPAGFGSSFSDTVRNASVNGRPVAPNIQTNPAFDSTFFL